MRKLLVIACLFIGSFAYAQEASVSVVDLTAGKVDFIDPIFIPENAVSDVRNVYFDKQYPGQKRKGMKVLNTSVLGDGDEVISQYEYIKSDGSLYHIAQSSTSLYERQTGANFDQFKLDYSSQNPANYTVFIDTLVIVNGVNNVLGWNGTNGVGNTWDIITSYQFEHIITWQNRLWGSGDTDEPSKLRASEFLDSDDFAIPATPIATDPAVFDINSQDGQKVKGLFFSPNGNLGILKEKSVWEIGGYDRDDFYLRLVNSAFGCVDQKGVEYKEGLVIWLSEEGFIAYDGINFKLISNEISQTIDSIKQLKIGSGSFSKDAQGDWETYTSTAIIDLITNPGSINLDFEYPIDQTYANAERNLINIVQDSSDSYHIIDSFLNTGSGKNNIYEYIITDTGDITETIIDNNSANDRLTLENSKRVFSIESNNKKHCIYSANGSGTARANTRIIYATATYDSSWSTSTAILLSPDSGSFPAKIYPSMALDTNGNPHIVYSSHVVDSSSYYSMFYTSYTGTSWITPFLIDGAETDTRVREKEIIISDDDKIHIFYSYSNPADGSLFKYSSATVGSSSFSTSTILSTSISYFNANYDSNDNPWVTYQKSPGVFFSSYSSTGWNTEVKLLEYVSNVNDVVSGLNSSDDLSGIAYFLNDRQYSYFSYQDGSANSAILVDNSDSSIKSSGGQGFLINNSNKDIAVILNPDNDKMEMYNSSATYISEIYDTGFTTYTFQTFDIVKDSGDQDLTHYLRTATTSGGVTSATWNEITENTTITTPVGKFMQYRVIFSTNILSNNLTKIDSITINYRSDSEIVHIASMNYDRRVWFAIAISSAIYNDRQLIFDKNNVWTDFTSSIGCASLLNLNGTPYWGSNDGFIYQIDIGDNDNGAAIESYIVTKDYTMGTILDEKTLNNIYVQADDSGDWNLTLDYFLNRSLTSTNSFNIDLDQTSGIINYKVPVTKQIPFYTISFKLSNNNADEPWNFLGLKSFGTIAPRR